MSERNSNTPIRRRTVVKGAAWSVPAITVVSAAPAFAASPNACGCMQPGLSVIQEFSAEAVTVLGFGTVTGAVTFGLNAKNCSLHLFKPAYTVVGSGGRIEFNDDTSYNFNLNLSAGAGSFESISAIASPFSVIGKIRMPNGGGLLSEYRKKPTRVCVRFTVILIPVLLPLPQVECRYELCMDLQNTTSAGGVLAGTGTVNWTGVGSNPVLTPLP